MNKKTQQQQFIALFFNRVIRITWPWIISIIIFFCCLSVVSAHTFQPSKVDIAFVSPTQFSITIETDLIELAQTQLALTGTSDELIQKVKTLSKIQLFKLLNESKMQYQQQIALIFDQKTEHINALFAPNVQSVLQKLSFDAATTDYRVVFSGYGQKPAAAKTVKLFFPELLGTVKLQISSPTMALLSSGVQSEAFEIGDNVAVSDFALQIEKVVQYVYQGIVHIVPRGFDHILFVLALFLLSSKLSTLLWQVSAFTLAHTVSLALAMFGMVQISSSIVEPLIALSIAYVAIENIFYPSLSRWRIALVFMFGLLHGLGFASVLMDVGLPRNYWLSSLISFNVGVEFGQLLVISLAFLLLAWARKNPSFYRQRVVIPLSAIIALMGTYWFIERVFY